MTFQGILWSHRVWTAIGRRGLLSKLPGLWTTPLQWVQGKRCACVPAAEPPYPREQGTPQAPHTNFTQIFRLCYFRVNFLQKFLFFALIVTHSLTVFHIGARMKWSIFLWNALLSNSRKLRGATKWSQVTHCLLLTSKTKVWRVKKRTGILIQEH